MPTRAAIASAAAAGNTNNDEGTSGTDERITVGRLVDVASRTWPGINKPGGIARVTRLYEDEGEPLVDVSYVVGSSKEKRVPLEYVTLAPDYEVGTTTDSGNSRQFVIRPSGLRDRSLLLGRCRRCGSLRADCGSCDWVTEEEELKQKQLQQEEQMMPAKSTVLEDSSSSSDDSDGDMVALRELFRRNQEKYRSRMKHRRQSNSRMETTKKSDEAAHDKRPQATSKRKDAESSDHNDDTDDDDDLDDLLLQSQRRFRRQPQRQRKWQHRLKVFSNTPSAKLKNRNLNQRSVLESLGGATSSLPCSNHNLVDAESRKKRRKGASGHTNHGTMNLKQSRDQSTSRDLSGSLHSPQSPILNRQIEQQRETNVEKNDVDASAEMPSPESPHQESSFVPFEDDDNDDDDLPSTQAQVSELQQRVPSYLHDPNDVILMDAADNIFIQPEGHDAAENLPSDMIDRTKDVSFANLPQFFDETTDQLENVMIPDYAYRIAKLEREHRRLVSPGSLSQTTLSVTKLLQDCSSLYNEMEHAIIREGIDQCTIALKKLSDDRLFRKYRKDLSSLQRKKIRSSTHMDARNLRLDALEDSVKDLVRNLRRLLERLEEMNDDPIMENEDSDIESLNDHAFQARKVVARDTAAGSEDLVHPSERELGTFHPHHFATRKKKTSNSIMTNRRKSIDNDNNVRQPKRRRGNVDGDVSMDNFIVDDLSHQQRSNKPRQMKPISSEYTVDAAQDNGGRIAGVDASTDRRHDESSEDENDDDTAIANLFDDEASSGSVRASGDTRVTSSATVSSRRPQRTIARSSNIQNEVDNNCWDMPSRYRRDSIPIARRMQAFLDKNNECSFSDDDEQDNQEITAISKPRSRRQGVIGNNGDRRRQYGSSAVLHGQSLTDGASSLPSGRNEGDLSSRSSRRESVVPNTIISREYLLSRMEDHDEISINRDNSNLGTPAPLAANQIHEAYLSDPSRVIEAVERLQSTSLRANTTCVKELQDSAMDLLARHGHQSIIESIVARSKYLAVNLRLLAVLVRRNDEIILGGRREDFLSLVVFQMVDAVYALLHPTAWTPYEVDRERALQLLESFRDDLAQSIPLIEAVCRCIMQQLPCQEWKVSDGHKFMYISSFEPSLWTRFVKNGECTLIPCPETRYQKLGKVWPRIEIEAMWNLLLFFGTVCSKNDQTNQNRWQLVSKLFSSSVLAKSSSDDHSAFRLPPNPDLLRAFEADMECLSSLIRKGAMDDLPPTDKLLFSMLKRALSLQAEDYYGNGESRFRSHPTLGTHRKAHRLASRLWKSTQRLMNLDHLEIAGNSTCVHELVFSPRNQGTAVNYMRDLLLPSSGLLGGCLSLVVRWGGRLPKKKVRQSRFLKGLKALRDSLFTLESEIVEKGTSPTSANDAFTNAFEGTLPHGVETPESRVSLFFAEVKCYLLILESILDTSQPNEAMVNDMRLCGKGLSQTTVTEIWETISCDELEALRQSVRSTPSKLPCGSLGSFQCFLSGKIMAIVAFLCLGVSPWRIDVNQTAQERLYIDVDEYNSRIEYYAYPLSCLFTCISALSSQAKDSTFLCHLISSVVLLFNQLTTLVVAKGTSPTINRVGAHVDSSYLPLLTGVLKQHCGLDADTRASQMLYGLILSAIRAVTTFQTMRVEKEAEAHADREMRMSTSLVTGSGGDDCFEDQLDDSIFASIETGPLQRDASSSSNCSKQHWTWIFDTLTSLVDMSVCSTVSEKSSIYLSSTAKFFMRQETQKICDCLIALALAQRACNATPLWSKIVSWIQLANRNDIDTEIERKISKRLLVEICLLCLKRKACQTVVAEHLELFLCGIIRVLLDGNRLELFPTCNFDLLMDLAGDKATREELTAIDTFNGVTSTRPVHMSVKDFRVVLESQRRRRERAGQPWEMIKNISFAFNHDRVFLGDLFRASDHDLPSAFQISITSACLEKEIISCFLFFRNLITQLSRATTHAILYQTMIGSILSILASEILRVVRGLKYIDLTSQGLSKENGGDSDRGRIVALLHAMSELFIATAAWILRENRSNESSKWKRVQTHLCENILYPLLQRKHFDMTFSLGKLIEVCRPLASLSVLAGPPTTTGIPGCSKYFAHCYDIALRRSRQLVSSEILTSVLLSYMIEGVHESERESENHLCEIVGQSFCTRPSVPRHHSRGPLEEEMDQYLGHVESYAPHSNHKDRMTEKRMDGIRSVIVPKLSQRKNDIVAKRQILRIAKHMLLEEDALRCSTTSDVDIMSLTASFARSVRHAFVQCLAMPQVDDELITVIIDCTRNLARLDTAEFEEDRKGMVRLCEELIANIDDWEILCGSELRALYLHSFFRWIFFICNSLSRDGNACMNTVTALRRFCSREKHDLHSDLEIRDFVSKKKNPEVDGDDKNFVTWGGILASVDSKLFGSKSENERPVMNVYAKSSTVRDALQNVENEKVVCQWSPSNNVTRAAKEYMTMIVSNLS